MRTPHPSAALIPLFVVVTLAATPLPPARADAGLCRLVPGSTLALVRVERDTTLPLGPTGAERMSMSEVRPGPSDSMLATPATPMPAARVRLLQLDSATRAIFAANGIADSQPAAFLRAAPYRADCRTLRWTDTTRFVTRGEVGYVRATLAPRDRWIGGVPVLVVPEVWNYPYPRRRALAFDAPPDAPLAPAEALFTLDTALEVPRPESNAERLASDSARRNRATRWAAANPLPAELEPARSMVRRAVLDPDWAVARNIPSRLRGTYRVDVETGGARTTWFFRTHDRPGYPWSGPDSLQTTAAMLASPHILGYRLVGYASASRDSIPTSDQPRLVPRRIVWLATTDRPTAPGNDARRELPGMLELTLAAAPANLWDDLEPLVPAPSARDSAFRARMNRPLPRGEKQPRIPLTLRLDPDGGVRADTTLVAGTRRVRVQLQRVDTLSIRRSF